VREEQVLPAHQLHWRYAADFDGSLQGRILSQWQVNSHGLHRNVFGKFISRILKNEQTISSCPLSRPSSLFNLLL
jgi:hypothetical protein